MLWKKFLIINIFLTAIILSALSNEDNLAKFYINKAYQFYKSGQLGASKEILERAIEYSQIYPEYYYIYNLLLGDKRENNHLKKENADKIVEYIDNLFLIERYDLLKQTGKIFEDVKEFEKSFVYYKKLILIQDKMSIQDHIDFIEMLFKAKGKPQFDLIPEIINESKVFYESLDFDYYSILFIVLKKRASFNDFNFFIKKLSSNGYSEERLLYLKSLFFSDRRNIINLYNDYRTLVDKKDINNSFKKRIIYNLLLKSNFLGNIEILNLLTEWNNIGQNDFKTLILLNDRKLYDYLNKDDDLHDPYINYTGTRMKDNDEDEEWEELYEYKNGILTKKITDVNQDGIYETMTMNYDEGNIKEFYVYTNIGDYKKYVFNRDDKSLEYAEYYIDNSLKKKLMFINSYYYPDANELINMEEKALLFNVDYVEEWGLVYKKIKYHKSLIEYINIDTNHNQTIDKRELYKDGRLDVVLKDNNENGRYEIYEKYSNGNLSYITYRNDQGIIDVTYKEVFFHDRTQKYWDYDNDNKYEISVVEYNNGLVKKMFDINYDGNFEYVINLKNDNTIGAYRVIDDKKMIEEKVKIAQNNEKEKKNEWNIVTSKDPATVVTPDSIIIKDKASLSGEYYYDGRHFFFKNGMIGNEDFSYKLFLVDNKIFLFENY